MPVIEITMTKATVETRRALIERLTADAIEITKIPAVEFTVLIHELDRESIGRSGRTCADIMAEMKAAR
jgi:4-oxalocrotonate tautomerase family enzyme